MTRIKMKAIVPDEIFDVDSVRKEIKHTLKEVTGKKLQKDFRKTVKTWKGKPRFFRKMRDRKDSIAVIVHPTGKHKDKYIWVHEGTRTRTITPRKKGGLLKFRRGYNPATRKRFIGATKASSYGPMVSMKSVKHSIEAREFSKEIVKRQKREFKEDIQRAINRAVD